MNGDPLDGLRSDRAGLVADRDALLEKIAALAQQAVEETEKSRVLADQGDGAGAAASQAAAQAALSDRRTQLAELAGLDAKVQQLISGAALDRDPCDAEPSMPLLLLPVRLETRYSQDGSSLRVRIFPDDVHVDQLERGLTPTEADAGRTYWSSLWTGEATEDAAWLALVQAVHPNRAPWTAAALAPTNLAQRPDPPGPTPAPTFPDVQPPTLRPPVARCLPDRFVVYALQAGAVRSEVGAPIPPELVVGLPRDADPASLVSPDGKLTLGAGMEWLADYDEAVRVGMAVTVPLAAPAAPVDEVFAIGVRASSDPAAAAGELGSLLSAHSFAEGVAFVPTGAPTNNTETDRTDWTKHTNPIPPATRPGPPPQAGSAAALLANALGLAPDALAGLAGGDAAEDALAAAANTALWDASFGPFIDRLLVVGPNGANIGDAERDFARDLFSGHVRGSGPLPTLRLGNQPYGMLPASSVDRLWASDPADPVEAALVALLRRIRPAWRASLDSVSRVGRGAIDETLLDVLGSAPTLLGLRVRSILSTDAADTVSRLVGIPGNEALQAPLDALLWRWIGLDPSDVGIAGGLAKTTRPVGLPLVDESDAGFIDSLLSDQPRTVTTVLQALLELAGDAARWAITSATPPEAAGHLGDAGKQFAPDLADRIDSVTGAALAGSADPETLFTTGAELSARFGAAGPSLLFERQPVEATRTSLADVAFQPGLEDSDRGRLALRALGAWYQAQARYAAWQAAVRALAAAPVAERQRVVADALDTASHRLDAWITAVVARRLAALRADSATGLLIGAYGWVENVVPGAGPEPDGGYIHTPGLAQAATAGVLRSAYLTHNPDSSGDGAFAIDLHSERARAALDLLDGVHAGQALGALLGYRLERALHEAALDRFVLSLRVLAPSAAGRLTEAPDTVPQQAREAVAASDVVDGVRLLHLRDTGTDIRAALAEPPKNNPYLDLEHHPWQGPTDAEWASIEAALTDVASTYDAAADLLLAEGVHQLVQGNTERAAAALDAASGGEAIPTSFDVLSTPVRGTALTYRTLLLIPEGATGFPGWASDAPRARAEPRLEAWAEQMLGPASNVVVADTGAARVTLDAAGISALDVVFDSASPAALEARLRGALQIGETPLPVVRDPSWPDGFVAFGELATWARSLRALIAQARAVGPAAFSRPSDRPARRVQPVALTELLQRVKTAADALGGAAGALAGLVQGPDGAAAAGAAIDEQLRVLAGYGIALPAGGPATVDGARAALAEANRRFTAAERLLADAGDVDSAQKVGHTLFGDEFPVLPVVTASPAPDLYASSFGSLAVKRSALRRFLADIASVRPASARHDETLLLADALSVDRTLRVVQLAPAGAVAAGRWVGAPAPDGAPFPTVPVTSLIVDGPQGLAANTPVAGLLLDEWTEILPRSVTRLVEGAELSEPTITTGLAVGVRAPAARAPQAALLAVSPDGARWTSDALLATVSETLELAKLRLVTLERLVWAGRVLPALQEQSWSLQGQETLDLRRLFVEQASPANMLRYIQE